MLLAGYLAQEVASLFREILSHSTLTLYDKTAAHLLCSNYWLKPIYQELVHASRFNATRLGEQKRPCSGQEAFMAHCMCGWIGGLCPVDTLFVWFPAHLALRVIRRLHEREQAHRAAHPAWFDLPGVSEDLFQKQKDDKAAREMSFKIAKLCKVMFLC